MTTNGLDIVCHITFCNRDFISFYPNIIDSKKPDTIAEDKCVYNSKR